jgi:ferredoxin-NADP reductase
MSARLIMKLRVTSVRFTTPDVLHVSFTHPLRPELPPWTPGAHVDVRTADGRVRQYSLCGDTNDRTRYEIAIKREDEGRGGSIVLHESLRAGVIAHVSAPRNNVPLVDGADRHILVAGGIGVTPLIAMARFLAFSGQDFLLHFCARAADAAPLLAEARAICGRTLNPWFSAGGRRFDPAELGPPVEGAHIYVCGPGGLVGVVRDGAAALGWPASQIHAEVFQAALDETFKPEPFDAKIASTGEILHVPADQSLLAVLRDHGIELPSSCELGVCGSCVCGYRDGTVIHRDVVIPLNARQDRIAPCVSRARVSVTLDL